MTSELSVPFTSLKTLDPALVDQLQEVLPGSLFAELQGSLSVDQDRLKLAEYKIRVLEERLRLQRIEKYGPGSEKLSDLQLELLELEPGVSSIEVEAESQRGQLDLPLKKRASIPGARSCQLILPGSNRSSPVPLHNVSALSAAKTRWSLAMKVPSSSTLSRLNTLSGSPNAKNVLAKPAKNKACSARPCRYGSSKKAWPVIGW